MILEELKKNWMLIGFVAMMILWYGNTNSRLTAVEAQQVEQATVQEKVDILITDVAVIKSESKQQSKSLDSLQDKVDYIISNIKH